MTRPSPKTAGHKQARFQHLARVDCESLPLPHTHSRNAIIDTMLLRQPISRVDLARSTGLHPSTIGSHVDQLLKEGLVREGREVSGSRGRQPTMLFLKDRLALLVADISGSHVMVGAIDLRGTVLSFSRMRANGDLETLIRAISSRMSELREQLTDYVFKGIGISLPSQVNPATQKFLRASAMHWPEFDVAGYLRGQLELDVEFVSCDHAGLLGEVWFGKQLSVMNAVQITVNEEVTAAALINGQVVFGHRGLAGAFGHVVHKSSGLLCECGRSGCLQMYASTTATLNKYQELAGLSHPVTLSNLVSSITSDEASSREAVLQQASALGSAARTITTMLDPEVVLISGDIASYWQYALPFFEAELRHHSPLESSPRIECIGDGVFSRLRGAGASILQKRSSCHLPSRPDPRTSSLQPV